MNPRTGNVLRLLGPLVEIVCLAILMRTWGEGRTVLGVRLESLLLLGIFVGLCMVVAGLAMSLGRRPAKAPRPRD